MPAKSQPEYKFADEIIDAVMEWIGLKWTPSMIRRQLREVFPDITFKTCMWLLNKARKRIRKLYGIDPTEYKGSQIAFYETVIRGEKIKIVDKLKAAERLDKLFGLENIANIDPALLAEKILEFKRQAMQTVGGEQTNGGSENDRNGESDSTENNGSGTNGNSRTNISVQSKQEVQNDNSNENSATTESIDENNTTVEEVNKELKLDEEL